MKTISKQFRFKRMWEVVAIDGQVYFLVKDILDYFGFSPKSQGTIKNVVSEADRMIITGDPVRNLKHISGRAMVVNRYGLSDFVSKKLKGDRKQMGMEFLDYIATTIVPEMGKLWQKEQKAHPDAPQPKQSDMFDLMHDQDVDQLQKTVKVQKMKIEVMQNQMDKMDKRITKLEKNIKDQKMGDMISHDGDDIMINANKMIKFLESTKAGDFTWE